MKLLPYPLMAGGAAAVLAAGLLVRPGEAPPTGPPSAPSNRSAPSGRAAGVDPVDVHLERLQRDHENPVEPERNPFRFEAPPPAPPRTDWRAKPRQESTTAPPPAEPLPPPPPPIPLRFIGLADPEGDAPPVGTFSDGRGNVFHGKQGDILEGRYRVLRIGSDSAELAYLDGRGRQTIRMSGQ